MPRTQRHPSRPPMATSSCPRHPYGQAEPAAYFFGLRRWGSRQMRAVFLLSTPNSTGVSHPLCKQKCADLRPQCLAQTPTQIKKVCPGPQYWARVPAWASPQPSPERRCGLAHSWRRGADLRKSKKKDTQKVVGQSRHMKVCFERPEEGSRFHGQSRYIN